VYEKCKLLSFSTANRIRDDVTREGGRFLSGEIFTYNQTSILASRPPSLESNKYHWLLSRGKNGREVKLTTHLHLEPRIRMYRLIPLLHRILSCSGT
jgi:hypothetical protein